jgi:hypothetical protein
MAGRDTQITSFCLAVGPWSGRILGEPNGGDARGCEYLG